MKTNARFSVDRAAETFYAAARWHMEHGDHRRAVSILQGVTMMQPNVERTWLALGQCHEVMGQPAIALQLYLVGSRVAKNAVRCLLAAATLCRAQENDERAVEFEQLARARAEESADDELVELVNRRMS